MPFWNADDVALLKERKKRCGIKISCGVILIK